MHSVLASNSRRTCLRNTNQMNTIDDDHSVGGMEERQMLCLSDHTRQFALVPRFSRWTRHDVALAMFAALYELARVIGREVEPAGVAVLRRARIPIATIVRWTAVRRRRRSRRRRRRRGRNGRSCI